MDHYYETLFRYIRQIIEIPESDKEQCRHSFMPVHVPKDTILEQAGKIRQEQLVSST